MARAGFLNDNRNRAFPFLKETVRRPEDGPLTLRNLPNDIIVDAGFVMGPKAGFSADAHTVYLNQLRRIGDTFYYEFASNAPELYNITLTFSRHLADDDYTLEFSDTGDEGLSESTSDSLPGEILDEPLWSGYLVSGSMASLAELLPSDGTMNRGAGAAVLEPALIQNLSGTYVTKIALANDDRTRVTAPASCPDVEFPYPTEVVHLHTARLVGHVIFKPGFNSTIAQRDGGIILGAAVGAGAGQPCDEVKLFEDEVPPEGSDLLEGGPRCNQVLRSINGIGGRLFQFLGGAGVTITAAPEENKVIVDINMSGLALCAATSQVSESC